MLIVEIFEKLEGDKGYIILGSSLLIKSDNGSFNGS